MIIRASCGHYIDDNCKCPTQSLAQEGWKIKERSILFNGPMVRAIRENRKTITRRVMKPHRGDDTFCLIEQNDGSFWPYRSDDGESPNVDGMEMPINCPYGQPGDRLWVRETWASVDSVKYGHSESHRLVYRADDGHPNPITPLRWKPSIHMPRWASRITLEITKVRVERIAEISEGDAKDEGAYVNGHGVWSVDGVGWYSCPSGCFRDRWNATYPGSLDRNDWVWVIEFRRLM